MNEVYLRGKLVSVYEPIAPASQPKHLVYQLRVSHKTAQQQVKFENYTVNTWRNLAVWASSNLLVGMDVFVRGHLSQRQSSTGPVTEVTALTITPVAGRAAADKSAVPTVDANVISADAPSESAERTTTVPNDTTL